MGRLTVILIFLTLTLSSIAGDYERFVENGKVGVKDNNGNIVLPASFDALGWSDGNFSVIGQITGYRQQDRWGLLNLKKEFITPAEFVSLSWPGGDRVIVSKSINPYTIKFGCIDLQGKLVVPLLYDDITLHGLRAIVMVKNATRYEYGLIDLNDRSVLPVRFQRITPIGSLRYAIQDFSNKNALSSEEGKWITDFTIDSISDFHNDLAVIYKEWKQGVINRNGEIKIEPLYRDINITGPGELTVRRAAEWEMIDTRYETLQRIEADELIFETNGWYKITMNGKNGLIDENFQLRWPMGYDYIGSIENQKAIVKQYGKFGLLRMDQSIVLPIVFDSLCLQDNFIRTRQLIGGVSSWDLYDTFGIKKTKSSYDLMEAFNGKFFPVKNRGYWGGVDRYGVERIACVYDSLQEMKDQWIVVRFKNHYGIISLEDQWKLPPQKYPITLIDDDHFIEQQDSLLFLKDFSGNAIYFTDNPIKLFPDHLLERLADGTEKEINFKGQMMSRKEPVVIYTEQSFRESEGLIGIKRDGKFGFVDSRGRLRIANRYDSIGEFRDGLAPVKLVGKWGYINASDQIVIHPTYEKTENFDKGIAQAVRKGKTGLINREGEVLLEFRYDSIRRLTSEIFLLTLDALKGLTDSHGNVLIEPRFNSLNVISEELVVVSRGGHFGVLTKEGVSVFPLHFSKLVYVPEKNIFLTKKVSGWETLPIGNISQQ